MWGGDARVFVKDRGWHLLATGEEPLAMRPPSSSRPAREDSSRDASSAAAWRLPERELTTRLPAPATNTGGDYDISHHERLWTVVVYSHPLSVSAHARARVCVWRTKGKVGCSDL
jgi:hypothetical protein